MELLTTLQDNHIVEILIVLAGILIVIDYFFPVDTPAHIGYVCLGLAAFFAFPVGLVWSIIVGLLTWFFLATGHRFWWGDWLENAPSADAFVDVPDLAPAGEARCPFASHTLPPFEVRPGRPLRSTY